MTSKNCIRVFVVAAIVAWPTIETYRLCVATHQAERAQQEELRVDARLASLQQSAVQVASQNGKRP